MSQDMFQPRPTTRSKIRTVVYLPKEEVSRTVRLLTSPTDGRMTRETTAFFKPYSVTTAPSSPSGQQTLAIGAGGRDESSNLPYRFASIERLVHRQKIYDSNPNNLPVLAHFDDDTNVEYSYSLSQKREMFFRENNTTPTPPLNANLPNVPPPPSFGPNVNNSTSLPTVNNINNKENMSSVISSNNTFAKEMSIRELDGYVGFANLPNQVYRKSVKKGFEFTLMIVGEAGLGKSTLINSMFLTDIYSDEYPGPSRRPKKTTQVETTKVLLKENGVNLSLTVVDTPGFGDAVDNSECWQPIIDFIESKYEEFLSAESRVHRTVTPDTRVHCCLYFIAPSGHGLKPLDIEIMKRLHDRVNVIPVLAKADTLTPEECSQFKRTILSEIAKNKIKVYDFPECDDEEENKLQKYLKERVPFAVVGSNTVIDVNGKRLRGRKYPWGVAEVENMEHCDFVALRNMLIRTHMQDLKDVTNNVHYENYRCRKLASVTDGKNMRASNKNPLAQMEEERKEHDIKIKKMEQELEQVFESKVQEKMKKLKDSEADLQKRHEQMKKSLEMQRRELDERWKDFEADKYSFELATKDDELVRKMSVDANSKDQNDSKDKKKEKKKGLF